MRFWSSNLMMDKNDFFFETISKMLKFAAFNNQK